MGKTNRRKPKSGRASYKKILESNDDKFTAPTPGLEHVLFAYGLVQDAANFTITKNKLTGHISI